VKLANIITMPVAVMAIIVTAFCVYNVITTDFIVSIVKSGKWPCVAIESIGYNGHAESYQRSRRK
jgi:predicted nucleic acid-binding Zn finger protein